MNLEKWSLRIFSGLVVVSLLTPFWSFTQLQFPYITSKAFFFRIAIELALPLYVVLLVSVKKFRPNIKNPLNIAVLGFLLINFLSAIFGVNPERSLWGNFERMGGVYYLVHLVALYFYVQLLGQAGGVYLKRFLQSFILVAVLVTLNGLSGWLGGPVLVQDPSLPARVSSTFGNPIFFASFLIIPMFLAGYFAVQEENRKLKIIYFIAAFLQFIGIYSSGTRGAVVGILAGLFIASVLYVVLTKNTKVRKIGLVLVFVFVALISSMYVFHDKFSSGSTLYRLANLKDSNTNARLVQWKIALTGFKERPVLGTGPENYYVIFGTYFNPEMYKYDSSWFDKPHNFLIEVLTTNGSLGLVAYLAMFVLSLWALWRAYRSGLLALSEACLLVAGLITYQVQNLFVFDTVSASVAFYGFLGMTTYMWWESNKSEVELKQNKKIPENLFQGILIVMSVFVLYVVYLTNFESMQAAKRTNFGYVYSSYDPKIAANYFKLAMQVPFNLDRRETANRYSDFATNLYTSEVYTKDKQFVIDQLSAARDFQKKVIEKNSNDPLLWLRLANDEMSLALATGQNVDQGKYAVDKALFLTPKRMEMLQLKSQYFSYQKNWTEVANSAKEMLQYTPKNLHLHWQLALAYFLNDQVEEAVKAGDVAVESGIQFDNLRQFAWYIQYYEAKKDFAKVAPLLEQAIVLEPNEIGLYIDLAKVYANLGNFDKARVLAEQVIKSDPSKKSAMQEFIRTLK